MKSLVQKLLLLSLAVAVALPLAAQDKERKKKGGGGGPVAEVKKKISELDLKEDQKKKIDEIIANYSPKLADATKAAGEAPQKMRDARKKLQDEGKKGKELNAAVKDTAKLTAEEQAGYDKLEALTREFRSAVAAELTDEQKDKGGFNQRKKKKDA